MGSQVMTIQLIPLDSRQVEAYLPQIVSIYRDAFSPPPYNKPESEVAEFAQSLPHHMTRDAFRFFGAIQDGTGQMAGFAYGYSSLPGQWWYEHVSQALALQTATEWLQDCFQFAEIAVSPPFQGQGTGGRLHDLLLAGIRHDKAVLSTLQAETAAFGLYRSRGWVPLLENLFFPGVGRRYQILGLKLPTLH